MKIGKFELVNPEKLDRAINGSPTQEGTKGGVGKDAEPAKILAAYDRLAGLVKVGNRKVKTGSFWNFKDDKAFKDPEVVYVARGIDGKEYEFTDEDVPMEVSLAEKSPKTSKKRAAVTSEDEDSEDGDKAPEPEDVTEDEDSTPKKTSKKRKTSVEDEE